MAEKIEETMLEVESSSMRGPHVRIALRSGEGVGVEGRSPVNRQQRETDVRGRGGRRLGVGGRRRSFSESIGMGVSVVVDEIEKEVVRNLMVLRAEGRDDLIALSSGRAQDSNSEGERDFGSLCTAWQAEAHRKAAAGT